MHHPAAMSVLLLITCFFLSLLLPTHAQHQTQRAAGGNTASASCLPHERDALLAFKHGITSDPAGLLDSWRRDDGGHREQDCCRWRGVRCSNQTGRVHELRLGSTGSSSSTALVGQISPSLLTLQHLEHLDLSHNELEGPTGHIPEFMGSLKSLKYLDLAAIQFSGEVPPQLGNLSKLQYLDLSSMGQGLYTKSTDLSWLARLPSIQHLCLNNVNLTTVMDWPRVMNMIPSLKVLHLSGCSLASANQLLPRLNLTNLEELDVSSNSFDHPMSASWFWNVTSLKYLDISSNRFYGQIPHKLTSLQVLDLSFNGDGDKNMGIMATDLKNLCSLEVLNIRSALLYGDITEMFKNLSHCSPNELKELDLGSNQLTGTLPKWIGQLTSLVNLDLSSNNITGPLPASVGRFTDLKFLDLSYNHLTGNVPHEIGVLTNLTELLLNNNDLDGMITKEHFANARSLQEIDLSYNAVNIDLSSEWQPPSKLSVARFADCQMGPLFPGWLQWQVRLTDLDISGAGIVDKLPKWFSNAFSNVERLNISNNQLIGGLPASLSSMSLFELHLSSSQLTGKIPALPPNISILDLSNNSLSGPLPSGSGAMGAIELSLFSNKLSGQIHESFCKYQGLAVLDLSNNFFEGELPPCLGVMEDMEFIALSNNSLSGEFPSFLENFTSMLFLDLSKNKFTGRLPVWIGNLVLLRILRLSHNKFLGNIPINITNLACLQYMDLSNNEISGFLPSYLSNLTAMRKTNMTRMCYVDDIENFHLISLSAVLKGQELNYGSISRVFDTKMMSIDLSSNNLTGEIPEEIVALNVLVNLNLSRNHFIGVVPNKIGEMQSLESLDLSRNKISGEIPATLSNLTFLSYLDLSYNKLTGRIPSGTQLDSLYAANPFMYIGNIGLCGHPLQNNCSRDDASKQGHQGRTKEGHGIEFFYLGLGCGLVAGTWMAFGVLLFKRSWRIAFFQLPDKLYDKVYVLVATWARRTQTDYHEADAIVVAPTKFSQGNFQIGQWSILHKEEQRPLFKMGCRSWETLIMAIFAKVGWNFRNRIEA
uniref:non-specific serine/threonine protein kinase n=1 Tax=Oryza punctata TaxID=4537 RepID=A0A0E0M9N1_ORYPU